MIINYHQWSKWAKATCIYFLMKMNEIHNIGSYWLIFWPWHDQNLTQQKENQQSVILILQPVPLQNPFKQVKLSHPSLWQTKKGFIQVAHSNSIFGQDMANLMTKWEQTRSTISHTLNTAHSKANPYHAKPNYTHHFHLLTGRYS